MVLSKSIQNLRHRDELRNEGTRERLCFRPSSLIDGCWSTVFRCPWNEEPDFCELDRKYRSQVLNGLSSVGPCIYVFAKSHSLHRLE